MRNISTKVDDVGDELSAQEYNSLQDELENIVTSTDQTLDNAAGPDTDLNMLGKAVADYAAGGQTYQDSGGINNYVLARSTNLKPISEYKDGMIAIFKAANANTGASTVSISGLTSKSLTQFDGSALDATQINTNEYVMIVYNSSSDRFELSSTGASEFASGTIMIFGNSTAPIGWTRKADWQDSAMFSYKASGSLSSGGSADPTSTHRHTGPSHTHTMQNHTHSMQDHTHTMKNHVHWMQNHVHSMQNHFHSMQDHTHATSGHTLTLSQIPSHTHGIVMGSGSSASGTQVTPAVGSVPTQYTQSSGGGGAHDHGNTGGNSISNTGIPNEVNTGSSPTQNTASPDDNVTATPSVTNTSSPSNNTTTSSGTGNTSYNTAPYYQQVIAATKD